MLGESKDSRSRVLGFLALCGRPEGEAGAIIIELLVDEGCEGEASAAETTERGLDGGSGGGFGLFRLKAVLSRACHGDIANIC